MNYDIDRVTVLNGKLIQIQKVKPDCVERIRELHSHLDLIKVRPDTYGTPEEVVDLIEGYEYALQALWNFPIDSNYHTHWNEVKGCTCPKLDNMELVGTPNRIVDSSCKFHGKKK